jgi:ankyrin repeat protein
MITPIINNGNTNKFRFRRFLIACIATALTLSAITIKANEDSTKQVAVSRVLEKRLNLVIKQNNLPELSKILDQGVNVDTKNRDGQTLLMRAAANEGSLPIMKLLLERGANPNERNAKGHSVLMIALSNARESEAEKIKKLELLARYNVDPTYRVEGYTVLNSLLLTEGNKHKLHKGLAALEMRYSKAQGSSQKQSIN